MKQNSLISAEILLLHSCIQNINAGVVCLRQNRRKLYASKAVYRVTLNSICQQTWSIVCSCLFFMGKIIFAECKLTVRTNTQTIEWKQMALWWHLNFSLSLDNHLPNWTSIEMLCMCDRLIQSIVIYWEILWK